MISRRHALRGTVVGAIAGVVTGGAGAERATAAALGGQTQGQAQMQEDALNRVTAAIGALREELRTERQFTELGAVRDAQKIFLRTNAKFPDSIEVGTDIWFAVHDWHVRWQQPLTIGRDALGRYTIVLNQTLVVMRTDTLPNFVGIPYDNRP